MAADRRAARTAPPIRFVVALVLVLVLVLPSLSSGTTAASLPDDCAWGASRRRRLWPVPADEGDEHDDVPDPPVLLPDLPVPSVFDAGADLRRRRLLPPPPLPLAIGEIALAGDKSRYYPPSVRPNAAKAAGNTLAQGDNGEID